MTEKYTLSKTISNSYTNHHFVPWKTNKTNQKLDRKNVKYA